MRALPYPLDGFELRRAVRRAVRVLLWLLPPVIGWLAARGGMGWELVTLLAVGPAVVASRVRRGMVPVLCLAGGCALLLGAGHGALPVVALPVMMLVVALAAWAARRVRRVAVLAPARPVWSMRAAPPAPFLLAERAPDGTLRMALLGRPAGRLRVTVS